VATIGFSFPSGHAVASAVTAVGLVIVLTGPGPQRWVWRLRAVTFAFVMALSRVYLDAHWLSEVVAGALLGGGLAIGWPALLQAARGDRKMSSAGTDGRRGGMDRLAPGRPI